MSKYDEIMALQKSAHEALQQCKWMLNGIEIELSDDGEVYVASDGYTYHLSAAEQIAILPILKELHGGEVLAIHAPDASPNEWTTEPPESGPYVCRFVSGSTATFTGSEARNEPSEGRLFFAIPEPPPIVTP